MAAKNPQKLNDLVAYSERPFNLEILLPEYVGGLYNFFTLFANYGMSTGKTLYNIDVNRKLKPI